MPAERESVSSNLHPAAPAAPRATPAAAPNGSRDLTLGDLGRAVAARPWTIVGTLLVALALSAAYLFAARPVYRATALVRIEEPPAPNDALEKLAALFSHKTPVAGEMELMRSRRVVGAVVDQLGLAVIAAPRRVPIVGDAMARHRSGPGPAAPALGLPRFGWGGEQIAVKRLEVSDDLLAVPLRLTALGADGWRLSDARGDVLLEGRVGTPAATADGAHQVELLVSELVARPGTQFDVQRLRRDEVIDAVQRRLSVAERVKDSGVVAIELEGDDPGRAAAIVSGIATEYVRLNTEWRSAEATATLAVLESKLPDVKTRLEGAERELNAFRTQSAIVDTPLAVKTDVERAADLDRTLSSLNVEWAEMARRYGHQYPDVAALRTKIEAVRTERAAVDARVRALPEAQRTLARLTREVNVATDLYTYLLEKAQALAIAKSGNLASARIVDRATASRRPVSPKPGFVLGLALLVGLCTGVGVAIARRQADSDDPRHIETATGAPVLATIPHSDRKAAGRARTVSTGTDAASAAALADPAIEQLRTLRTVLGFLSRGRGNVVAISSPSPGAGKTFVSANLAQLFAAAGKRVLLVDGDLRRGALHDQFSVDAQPGLSGVLGGGANVDAAIRTTDVKGLDLLPRGSVPASPAELLAGGALPEVLAALAQRYDLVLVDTPPSLAVTDAALIGRCAGVNLLVVHGDDHSVRELSLALEVFARSGVEVQGAVLNDVHVADDRYRAYYRRAASRS